MCTLSRCLRSCPAVAVLVLCLPAVLHAQEPPLFGESRIVLDHPDRVFKTTLTRDGLTVYFADLPRNNPGAPAIWEARRAERRVAPILVRSTIGTFSLPPDM